MVLYGADRVDDNETNDSQLSSQDRLSFFHLVQVIRHSRDSPNNVDPRRKFFSVRDGDNV